jgi:hypothetical protein
MKNRTGHGDIEAFAAKLDQEAPVGCDLKVGDIVTFINDYGVIFPGREIIGFDTTNDLSKYDRFIYMDCEAYWFPHKVSELIKESEAEGQARLQQWIKDNPDKVTRY